MSISNSDRQAIINPTKHSLELQGLRCLFIVAVLCAHYILPFREAFMNAGMLKSALFHLFNITWMGVDLFFTLSGFVVTLLLLGRNRDYWAFMKRRADRLLPAYFTMLAVVAVATLIAPLVGAQVREGFFLNEIWAWTLTANIAASMHGAILDGGSLSLIPTWSLCVEIQFYLLWPLVIWKFRDRHPLLILSMLAVLALLCRCLLSYEQVYYNVISSLTPFRIDQFAFGGLAAFLAIKRQKIRSAPWIACAILLPTLALLFIDPTWHKAEPWVHTIGYSLLGAGTAALVLSAYQETLWSPIRVVLKSRPMVMIGDRSYSIYLWHLPFHGVITSIVSYQLRDFGQIVIILFVVIINCMAAFSLAELSYRLIERRKAPEERKLLPTKASV